MDVTGVGVVPFKGGEASDHKHHDTDHDVYGQNIGPQLRGEGGQELEQLGRGRHRFPEQDGDPKVPEGLGEIYDFLAAICDSHPSYC